MKSFRKILSFALAIVMLLGLLPMTAAAADAGEIVYNGTESITYQGITFQRQQGGTYDGLPLFDADPAHLDAYLDVYMDYIGLDGMVRIGLEKRNDYTLVNTYTISDGYADAELAGKTITWENKNAGKVIPGSPQFSSPEAVQGYSTNFPAQIGVGQTWNTDLVAKEGRVVGTEKLYGSGSLGYEGSYLSTANQMVSTALTDLRINPLSGRVDEGYAEDPYLAAVMVDAMAAGVTGHDQEQSDGGFWQMAFVDTKHFSNYLAQWQRNYGSFNNSARGLVEYVARSCYKAFSNDHIGCFMTSYGSTNYIPNGMSPMIGYVKNLSSYPISTINDNGAETAPVSRLGNDYMTTYWPRRAEQIISQAFANASAGYQQRTADAACDDIYATVYAIQSGKLGVSEADFVEQAKGAIINQIRCGILNERDENGNPVNYPFADIVTGSTVYDYTNKEHQVVSLATAEESAVLLKNNGILPLSVDDDVVVTGQVADARFTTTYAGTTYAGENMGLTPLGGVMTVTGKTAEELHYTSGAKQVKLKSGDRYIVSDGTLEGTTATGTAQEAAVFDLYAWGQDDSISLLETGSNQWLGYSTGSRWDPTPAGVVLSADALHLGACSVNESNGRVNSSSMPNNMRREYVDEDSFRLLAGTFTGGFFNSFEQSYWTQGVYMKVTETGAMGVTESIGSPENAANVRTEDTVFTTEVVNEAGANVYTGGDAAIVVIGVSPTFSAGEGTDRIDLDLGAEQYELCHNVAAQYPGKTVVVVKVSSPVGLEELEKDANIGAILYQPYAGEYEGLGLANLLFGKANPSGHLANSWYADTSNLPAIDSTIIHNGWARDGVTLETLDPARDVLMTNGDPYDTGLTYMYNHGNNVVYEFGYGLSYSDFEIRSFEVPASVNAGETFQAEVEVANLSATPGYAVVQLYMTADDSPYGDAAPAKQLVGFAKVWVPAVTSATATITVDPADFAVYTADAQDMTVLSGAYTLMAGQSSENIEASAKVAVQGQELGTLDPTQRLDVFANSFAAKDVYYREYNRQSTLDSLKADSVTDGYYAVTSKWEGAWAAVANVNLYDLTSFTAEVGALEGVSGTIEIRRGSLEGQLIGTIAVPETGSTTYVLEDSGNGDNSDIEITELKFVPVKAELQDVQDLGTETIYFVFQDAELRLASFTAEVSEQPVPVELPFVDVDENAWYFDAVEYVYVNDLMQGTTDVTFAPGSTTTRGMTATILWRLAGSPEPKNDSPFRDVAANQYYSKAIAWAAENGIVYGMTPISFEPEQNVTREQLAAMLFRYAKYKNLDTTASADLSGFVDADRIQDYAKEAMAWANANQILIGVGNNRLAPRDNAIRAHIAQLMMNFCVHFEL